MIPPGYCRVCDRPLRGHKHDKCRKLAIDTGLGPDSRYWPRKFVPENNGGGSAVLLRKKCALCGEPFDSFYVAAKYHPGCAAAKRKQYELKDQKRKQRIRDFHEKRRVLAAAMEQILDQQGISLKEFMEGKYETPPVHGRPSGKAPEVSPVKPGRTSQRGARGASQGIDGRGHRPAAR